MLENTNIKQFYPGPILNKTLDITDFLFKDPEQIHITYTYKNEDGSLDNRELTYGTEYEVAKILPSDVTQADAALTASTGRVTLKADINVALGERLTIYRESEIIQETQYPRTGPFPAASHEGALDYLTMQNQEQQDQIDRSLKVPISTANFDGALPIPVPARALKINDSGSGFEFSEYDPDTALETTKEYMEGAQTAASNALASQNAAASSANAAASSATEAGNLVTSGIADINDLVTAADENLDAKIKDSAKDTDRVYDDIEDAKAEIVEKLNKIGGEYGVGIADIVEDRLVGMKSRGVYETPGGTILYAAHDELEYLCLDRDTQAFKRQAAIKFAELVYDGKWFTPLREALSAFVDSTQQTVTGEVKLKLYKGNISPAGAKSKYSLYNEDIASFGDSHELYSHKDAEGFINLFGLPLKVRALMNEKNKNN